MRGFTRGWWPILAAGAMMASGLGCSEEATAPPRSSVLDGRTVATTHFHGTAPDMTSVFGPVYSVVGPGVELRDFGAVFFVLGEPVQGFVDIDFSDTNVLITATRDQPGGYFEVLRFADANGTIPRFTRVTIDPVSDWPGLDASDLFVADDYFQVNLTALDGLAGQRISLDIAVDGSGG